MAHKAVISQYREAAHAKVFEAKVSIAILSTDNFLAIDDPPNLEGYG